MNKAKPKRLGRPPKAKSEVKQQTTIRVSEAGEAILKKNGHTPQSFFDLHLSKLTAEVI